MAAGDEVTLVDRTDMDEEYELEIQPEAGFPGRYKLYVHNKKLGFTMVRICKMLPSQFLIPEGLNG